MNKDKTDVVIFNESTKPVVRAGGLNLLFAVIPSSVVMIYGVFKDMSAPVFLKYALMCLFAVIVILLVLKFYRMVVARIEMHDEVMRILCSAHTIIVHYENIDYITIRYFSIGGGTIAMRIKERGRSSSRTLLMAIFEVKSMRIPDVLPTLKRMMADHKVTMR